MSANALDFPDTTRPLALMAPSLVRRMACWLYEGLLLFGVVFVAGTAFGLLTQSRNALAQRHELQFFIFVVTGIYFVWFWHKGQTLAMKTWRIRVVDRHGRPLSQGRALLRYLCSWVWFLPPLAAMAPFPLGTGEAAVLACGWVLVWALLARFHPERQFWHDAWAATRLVPADPPSTSR